MESSSSTFNRKIDRRHFLTQATLLGAQIGLLGACNFNPDSLKPLRGVTVELPAQGEDVFAYLLRTCGEIDLDRYRQIVGAASAFKEGDEALGLTATDERSRTNARTLLSNSTVRDLVANSLFQDELYDLIQESTQANQELDQMTLGELKAFLLREPEASIHAILPGLTSDIIGCLVKLMSNEELIQVGQKVFNPLPGSKIGSKGYLSARVQPNSPTDHPDDIIWQVFDAWSYGVGDLVLGTNPVSSEPESVARIENALLDLLTTFELEDTLPNCVLSHIDIQAQVEAYQPGTTGIWFQSLAGTVNANETFDVTIQKMMDHAAKRTGPYGLYVETGQGADFTNGHGAGFDMVIHEARKYGFVRALQQQISRMNEREAWVHVNDVAGFIGPEVFKTKEQLVRCCLEDTVMGKLHGLTIGLDICSTLHMDVSLEDLDWCIDQVMPANPAYLMALPTKNDPMLSYLTTGFSDHVRIREKFDYKVNDAMWAFFKKIGVIGPDDQPTEHFGDPIWVYYQYRLVKGDNRTQEVIYEEGRQRIAEIRDRGVPIAEGYGKNYWDLDPELDKQVHHLYEDAKVSIWAEMEKSFAGTISGALAIKTHSKDRKDYIYHPESGEKLPSSAIRNLEQLRGSWGGNVPDVQFIISDGLNIRSLTDEGHLAPFLAELATQLVAKGLSLSERPVVIQHGRVRAGYACGEVLFGKPSTSSRKKGIIHIIGERPGSGHHNFSAYLTAAAPDTWKQKGKVDHNISRVVSGVSDTALDPVVAAKETALIFERLFAVAS